MTTEFEVKLDGPTKSLLKAVSILATKKINLDTVSITASGHGFNVRFLTGSEENVRTSLMKADLPFRENKVLVVGMPNKPGQWLKVAEALAEAGVEISHSYRVGEEGRSHIYVFGVTDYIKAKKACTKVAKCAGE